MRTLALLLVAASLVLGVLGAVTAYLPRVSLPDEALVGLHLTAPAGLRQVDGEPAPIASEGATLTTALLRQLRDAKVSRIRVKEFSLARWDRWWLFAAGCVGLLTGGLMLRRGRAAAASAEGQRAGPGPERAIADLRDGLAALRRDLPAIPDAGARLALIMARIADLQAGPIAAFIAARPLLEARLGIAGYAQLMDRFAAAERQVNRAWSAAADSQEDEAVECLERAADLLGAPGPCPQCGYAQVGLAAGAPCPECGWRPESRK
ncbi:MAG: hypothetical protein WD749_09220 [Phycisphaerales bacterium]